MNNDWKAAYSALQAVYFDEAYSNLAINEALRESQDSSAGFVRVLTKGVIRDSLLLDYNIDILSTKGLKSINRKSLLILRMGIYAIAKMDSVPNYAAVNEAVGLSRKAKRGSEGFVNAILRSFIRSGGRLRIPRDGDQLKIISYKYSFPYHLVRFLSKQYGLSEIEHIISGLYEIPELCIRTNKIKIDRENLIKLLSSEGIDAYKDIKTESGIIISFGNIINSKLFKKGFYTVQSSSSIKSIEVLSAKEGDKILDLCAAPGGKTTAIAESINDNGEIYAADFYEHRVDLIRRNIERLNLNSIKPVISDALILDKNLEACFDRVLADVPCSGLGVIASKPELKYRVDLNELPSLYKIQARIMDNAFTYLKPNGIMVYSTCTINKKENEKIVEEFAKTHDNARILEYDNILPYNKQVGFYYCKIQKYSNL